MKLSSVGHMETRCTALWFFTRCTECDVVLEKENCLDSEICLIGKMLLPDEALTENRDGHVGIFNSQNTKTEQLGPDSLFKDKQF